MLIFLIGSVVIVVFSIFNANKTDPNPPMSLSNGNPYMQNVHDINKIIIGNIIDLYFFILGKYHPVIIKHPPIMLCLAMN